MAAAKVPWVHCRADCGDDMESFLKNVSYVQGQYDDLQSYEHLGKVLLEKVCCCIIAYSVHWSRKQRLSLELFDLQRGLDDMKSCRTSCAS
jgi:hypothetical protein